MKARFIPLAILILFLIAGPLMVGPLGLPGPDAQVGIPFAGPGASAPLGTDHLGRDVASAVLTGGGGLVATAAAIGVIVTAVASVVGCISALHPRTGMTIDAVADASILIPPVLVIMIVAVVWPGAGNAVLILTCSIIGVPYAARVIAGAAAGVASRGWVVAARAGGAPVWQVIFIDMLPNMRKVIAAVLGLRIVEALYLVSVASFLGVAGGLGDVAWSAMVRANAPGILINPAAVLAPSVMLAVAAVAVLATGGGVDDRLTGLGGRK